MTPREIMYTRWTLSLLVVTVFIHVCWHCVGWS